MFLFCALLIDFVSPSLALLTAPLLSDCSHPLWVPPPHHHLRRKSRNVLCLISSLYCVFLVGLSILLQFMWYQHRLPQQLCAFELFVFIDFTKTPQPRDQRYIRDNSWNLLQVIITHTQTHTHVPTQWWIHKDTCRDANTHRVNTLENNSAKQKGPRCAMVHA